MGVAFAVLFVLNLAYGALAGTLSVSLPGLTLAPLLGALVINMVIGSIRDLRKGPRQRGVVVR